MNVDLISSSLAIPHLVVLPSSNVMSDLNKYNFYQCQSMAAERACRGPRPSIFFLEPLMCSPLKPNHVLNIWRSNQDVDFIEKPILVLTDGMQKEVVGHKKWESQTIDYIINQFSRNTHTHLEGLAIRRVGTI